MQLLMVLTILLITAAPAWSAGRPTISRVEFARAVNEAGKRAFAPVRSGRRISPEDVRVVSCSGPDEEPTESECTWLEHEGHRWIKRRTWLAIDGRGWHVID
jgi:hypothetical protein